MRGWLVAAVITLSCSALSAQNTAEAVIGADTVTYAYTPIDQSGYDDVRGDSGRKFLSARTGDNSSLDFTIAPIYSSTTNFGIALNAQLNYGIPKISGNYGSKPSALSLYLSGSINGYYRLMLNGINRLNNSRDILSYGAEAGSMPTRLWGLNYDDAIRGNYARYTEKTLSAWFRYSRLIAPNTYLGIVADIINSEGKNLSDGALEMVGDRATNITTAGIGLQLDFDNYHNRIDPPYGFRVGASATYRPRLLSNIGYDTWQATVVFDYYQSLWQGGLLALDIYGRTQSKHTPWLLLAETDGDSRMRGYYPGRFRGNTLISAQLELRQHIWNGIGAVAWAGAGNIFSPDDPFAWRKALPTYGVGLRYRLGNASFRVDFGFGRDSFNAIVGVNESF